MLEGEVSILSANTTDLPCYSVLLVEDDEVDCEWVGRLLKASAQVCACHSAAEARKLLASNRFDCLILDLGLPDVDGIEFVAECVGWAVPVVVLTGNAGLTQAVAGMRAGAYDYILKDNLNRERLASAVSKAIETKLLQAELKTNRAQLEVAQKVLSERERRLSFIVENINEVFWIASPDRQRFLYVSPQSRTVWGLEPEEVKAAPRVLLDRLSPDDRKVLTAKWSDSQRYELEYRLADSQEERWLREKAVLSEQDGTTLWVGTTEDITERKLLEAQFRSAERMKELGKLAGGLSHDFNNLLTCILGYTQTARLAASQDHQIQHDLAQVEEAGRQAQRLIKQLLGFSKRKVSGKSAYCNLNTVVTGMTNLLSRTLGENIRVEVTLPETETYVALPRSQAEQIILNLSVNAKDAMPEGGTLTLELGVGTGFAKLRVTDSGVGMDERTRLRLFEAFFTTKGERGTGLGLFTISEILNSVGGNITVSSHPGQGTTFQVLLPLFGETDLSLLGTRECERVSVHPTSAKILVAENRQELGELFERLLQRAGHNTTLVKDGLEALMVLEQDPAFDLLVTDIQMPGIGGAELSKRVGKMYPDIPILFISGQPDEEFQETLIRSTDGFLEKPFTGSELNNTVSALLIRGQGDIRV